MGKKTVMQSNGMVICTIWRTVFNRATVILRNRIRTFILSPTVSQT